MITRDDVPHDRRLPVPIQLTIRNVDTQPQHPRDVELIATDVNGDELHVIIWKTHDIDHDWVDGQLYKLSGVRGKRIATDGVERVELHSTNAFRARDVDPTQPTRLFVLGDTHVGYRHRPASEKPAGARNIDDREIFSRCLERARAQDVDAVVHAGDVFDHRNSRGDRRIVHREIRRTVDAGIPFYYVFGNHDDAEGRRLLASTSGIHLPEDVASIGTQPVNLLGVDYSGSQFPTGAPAASTELQQYPTILIIHDTPYPVVDAEGTVLYHGDSNSADISDFIETAPYGVDLVITGHLHVATRAAVEGSTIPVLVTGPTAPISILNEKNHPSTWLVTMSEDGIDVERQQL